MPAQHFPSAPRLPLVGALGLRPLTVAEQRKYGLARGYTRAAASTPAQIKRGYVPRRQAEQRVMRRTFERLRDIRAERTGAVKMKLEGRARFVGGRTQMRRYGTILSEYAQRHGVTRGEARRSPELKRIVRDLRSKDNSPGGRKARALEALGRREPEWRWQVGDTPTFR